MPRYETPQDKKTERLAMKIMGEHLGVEFDETPDAAPLDFLSEGYACEHKCRPKINEAKLKYYGSIYLEVQKYWALMTEFWENGRVPLLVVTFAGGQVGYIDVREIDIRRTEVANRAVYRGPGDDDECFHADANKFVFA